MEEVVKCFDVATMVTDEATEQFGSLVHEDKEKKNFLKYCCSIIDDMSDRFNGVAFEVEVDDETTDITISLTCSEFELNVDDRFYELLKSAKSFGVKVSDDDTERIQLDFVFGGIWVSSR